MLCVIYNKGFFLALLTVNSLLPHCIFKACVHTVCKHSQRILFFVHCYSSNITGIIKIKY